jgi:hypothetical protein
MSEGLRFDVRADDQAQWVLDIFISTLSVIESDESLMKLLREVRHY